MVELRLVSRKPHGHARNPCILHSQILARGARSSPMGTAPLQHTYSTPHQVTRGARGGTNNAVSSVRGSASRTLNHLRAPHACIAFQAVFWAMATTGGDDGKRERESETPHTTAHIISASQLNTSTSPSDPLIFRVSSIATASDA
ncbi:hypothetical protein BJV74DRAFT_554208 [Russula compacta]|nr:hypothetical protein BJV74DRAFT_554208 [Russula compacta]